MPTPLLGLTTPTQGSLTGAWGDVVNNEITTLLDSAVAGTTTLSTDVDVTLTDTQSATNQAREAIILWTAAGTVTRNITAPYRSKTYIVINASGTQSIVLRGTGPTTGITIVANEKCVAAWNGSDFVKVASSATAGGTVTSVTGTAPVVSSGGNTPAISMPAATSSVNGYLTSANWTTFNAKQGTITLTTTGTSGAATFNGTTLNIPQYSGGGGGGTVTSVGLSAPAIFTVTGSPVTGTGTLTLSYSGTALPVANGGTGVTTSTGSGNNVLSTSPTIATPTITGDATVSSMNFGAGPGSGGNNIILGNLAGGGSSSTGGNNITIGTFSGGLLTTGAKNTGVGIQSLRNISTGGSNTALGYFALNQLIVGSNNVAVGDSALANLYDQFSGTSNNTAVGYGSGFNTTTGTENSFVGKSSGSAVYTSTRNVAVGWAALDGSLCGIGNTAVGALALNGTNSSSATYNTAVGNTALSNLLNFTNCTGLGYSTGVTGSNQVQLGDSATTTYYYAIAARSDLRDKTDVRDTQLGLGFINALRPVDYKWDMRDDYKPPMPEIPTDTEDPEYETALAEYKIAKAAWVEACDLSNITHDGSKKRNRYHHGLIAQEVKAVLDAQGIDFGGYQDHKVKDGQDVLTIGYDELIAPLIKAIQELTARVKELEAK